MCVPYPMERPLPTAGRDEFYKLEDTACMTHDLSRVTNKVADVRFDDESRDERTHVGAGIVCQLRELTLQYHREGIDLRVPGHRGIEARRNKSPPKGLLLA